MFPGARKNILFAVTLITLICLGGAVALSVRSTNEMRTLVADQFNQEQLVLARHVATSIQRKIGQIGKDLLVLRKDPCFRGHLPSKQRMAASARAC